LSICIDFFKKKRYPERATMDANGGGNLQNLEDFLARCAEIESRFDVDTRAIRIHLRCCGIHRHANERFYLF